MFSVAQSKQKTLGGGAWQGSVSEVRSLKKSPPTSPAAASESRSIMRSLRCLLLVALRLRRAEELGDDLDREDAGDPAFAVDHRRVLRLRLQEVGEGVAHNVVALQHRAQRRIRF